MLNNEPNSVQPLCDQFIQEARSWLKVKWVDGGRSRNGIDCLGLIVVSARNCGIDVADHPELKSRPGMKSLMEAAKIYCDEISTNQLVKGAIVIMQVRGEKQAKHVGIYDGYRIIHCGMRWGKVVEHRLNSEFSRSIRRAFILKEFQHVG